MSWIPRLDGKLLTDPVSCGLGLEFGQFCWIHDVLRRGITIPVGDATVKSCKLRFMDKYVYTALRANTAALILSHNPGENTRVLGTRMPKKATLFKKSRL